MASTPGAEHGRADLVLFGGQVRTLDQHNTTATAIAVANGRVLAVGRDRDTLALAHANGRCYDLDSRTALPGFTERAGQGDLVGRSAA